MTDPLSDVLRSVRLTGGVFLNAYFTAPWSITAQVRDYHVSAFLQLPAQLICYHVVKKGKLLLSLDDGASVEVHAGEIILLPRNDPHALASAAGLNPVQVTELIQPSPNGAPPEIVYGGGGEQTHVICGFLGSSDAFNPLIATLPRVLTLNIREGMSRAWIEASVQFAANELVAGRLASSGVMSRLSELLLVEAVRQYSSTLADDETSWLKGLNDPYIGRALALIHQDLGASWSADALASAVALSRSAFVDRFSALIGMPPIRYVTVWRLQAARLLLRETQKAVSQIAHSVGYQSEEAFSRAFKREFGLSPTPWRNQ